LEKKALSYLKQAITTKWWGWIVYIS